MNIKTIYTVVAVICLMAFSANISLAAEKAPAELEKLQAYRKKLDAVQKKAYASDVSSVKAGYKRMLNSMKAKAQKEGNLEAMLAIKKEITRYEASSDVTDADLVSEPADLLKAQQKFMNLMVEKKNKDMKARHGILTKYRAALKRLTATLTKKGAIDDAIAVENASKIIVIQIAAIESDEAFEAMKPAAKPDVVSKPKPVKPTAGRLGMSAKDKADREKLIGTWSIYYPDGRGSMTIKSDGSVHWMKGRGTWKMEDDHVMIRRSASKTFKIPRPISTRASKYGAYRISKQ